jgi:hypothetical protein
MMKKQLQRQARGATMGVVIVCCIILIILVIGLFHVTMIFGGSQELRNSVDAGTLNVGKEAVTLTTTSKGSDEQDFDDVRDKNGEFGITNINRVLGKSFLINANAQAMDEKGMGSGDSSQHANKAVDAAQAICDKITAKLKDPTKTQPFFTDFIKVNSVNMFGKPAEVVADNTEWDTACVDRDEETNLRVDAQQMPDGYSYPGDATKGITEKGAGSATQFFKGYHSIPVNSKQLAFVPYKYDEKPHLINGFYFAAQQKLAVPNWTAPVPNALSTKGKTDKIKVNNTATAYVVTNPQHQYQLAMPHSYIHIHLDENEAKWKYQGLILDKTTHYGYYPGQTQFHIRDAGSGTMTINAVLGNQYLDTTLYHAVNPLTGGQNDTIMNALLQRAREIKHDCTMDELKTAMMNLAECSTIGMDSGDFYIFCTYTKADNSDPKLHAARDIIAKGLAPWISGKDADGSQKDDFDTDGRVFVPFVPTPNVVTMTMEGIGCKPGPFGASEDGHLDWKPGTGFGGCLGKLTIHRTTTIYYTGLCTVL